MSPGLKESFCCEPLYRFHIENMLHDSRLPLGLEVITFLGVRGEVGLIHGLPKVEFHYKPKNIFDFTETDGYHLLIQKDLKDLMFPR